MVRRAAVAGSTVARLTAAFIVCSLGIAGVEVALLAATHLGRHPPKHAFAPWPIVSAALFVLGLTRLLRVYGTARRSREATSSPPRSGSWPS